MNDTQINELLQEIKKGQHISAFEEDAVIEQYIREAEYDINDSAGTKINYSTDLKARSLLKDYVFYARYKRLAEFKQLYGGEYAYIQAKYYRPADL